MDVISRYKGALLGEAIGDALGGPLEAMTSKDIKEKFSNPVTEMIGGGWLSATPGEVTDDTQLTLAIAEGIVEADNLKVEPFQIIGENFLRWYKTHPKDVGDTCANVMSNISYSTNRDENDWNNVAKRYSYGCGSTSSGNGALMRTIYPALWYKDPITAENMAMRIGNMTHYSEISDLTIKSYTSAVNLIANTEMSSEDAKVAMNEIMCEIKQRAEEEDRLPPKPTGYCLDSLMCAIDAINKTSNFEDALVYVVNQGGDADTIGALTGGLAGVIYGFESIPARWISSLENEENERIIKLFKNKEVKEDDTSKQNMFIPRLMELAVKACKHVD